MTKEKLLLFILILFIAGTCPVWPYSRSWGYVPAGVLALVLIVFLLLTVAGGRQLF